MRGGLARAVRRAAMMQEVPCITTLTGAAAAVQAIRASRQQGLDVDIVAPGADLSGYRMVLVPTLPIIPPLIQSAPVWSRKKRFK